MLTIAVPLPGHNLVQKDHVIWVRTLKHCKPPGLLLFGLKSTSTLNDCRILLISSQPLPLGFPPPLPTPQTLGWYTQALMKHYRWLRPVGCCEWQMAHYRNAIAGICNGNSWHEEGRWQMHGSIPSPWAENQAISRFSMFSKFGGSAGGGGRSDQTDQKKGCESVPFLQVFHSCDWWIVYGIQCLISWYSSQGPSSCHEMSISARFPGEKYFYDIRNINFGVCRGAELVAASQTTSEHCTATAAQTGLNQIRRLGLWGKEIS